MKKQNLSLLMCAGLVCGVMAADNIKPLGKMDGFYRYSAVLGPHLEIGGLAIEIPSWMQQTDFPYPKRPYSMEIPFADGLSVVRLLSAGKTLNEANGSGGGADLVQRDANGQLRYRWDLLKARLDPYINMGYTDLTLVMDNMPWCFPEKPVVKEYGQIAPPTDYQEWYAFIKAMCSELRQLYGEDAVKHFRFRMGTELQDKRRWIGGYDSFLQYYDLAAKAVKDEIPEAGFGPFNRSVPQGGEAVSILDLAKHCADNKLPFDFLARSFYYFSAQPNPRVFKKKHPDERLSEIIALWNQADQILGRPVSREVHEFGPHLSTEENLYGLDTGARGAAQTLDTVLALREAGVNRLWHWQFFEKIAADQYLLYSGGWLYSIFDSMRGGESFSLPVQTDENNKNSHSALLSVLDDRAILTVSCWNIDRTKREADRLTVKIPKSVISKKIDTARRTVLTESNSVYDVIRRDFIAAGMLSEKHKKHRGNPAASVAEGGYDCMAADRKAGKQFVSNDWKKYERLMRDALTLSDFDGSFKQNENGITVSFDAANPSVTVIVLNFNKTANAEK